MTSLKPLSHKTLDSAPSLPPEASKVSSPDYAQLAGMTNTGSPPVGNMQSAMMALQMGAATESMLEKLSELLPEFAVTAAQIIPLLRGGLRDSVLQMQGNTGGAGVLGGGMQGGMGAMSSMMSPAPTPTQPTF